jgi:DNA-binding LacI/PurR family transcriptional regulator
MHIAYSAFRTTGKHPANKTTSARYQGYLAACQKHGQTIAAIREYLPGWEPLPPSPLKGELFNSAALPFNY